MHSFGEGCPQEISMTFFGSEFLPNTKSVQKFSHWQTYLRAICKINCVQAKCSALLDAKRTPFFLGVRTWLSSKPLSFSLRFFFPINLCYLGILRRQSRILRENKTAKRWLENNTTETRENRFLKENYFSADGERTDKV